MSQPNEADLGSNMICFTLFSSVQFSFLFQNLIHLFLLGGDTPTFFLFISSSWIKIRLQTEYQLSSICCL
jgi:hypothetical protein